MSCPQVGIDDALVMESKEEIFEMNNGCICCTGARSGPPGLRAAPWQLRAWQQAHSGRPCLHLVPPADARPRMPGSRALFRTRPARPPACPPTCLRACLPARPPRLQSAATSSASSTSCSNAAISLTTS
jgi:hypothetical protein